MTRLALLLALAACAPKPPPAYSLGRPVALPDKSLVPAGEVELHRAGYCLPEAAAVLEPALAAGMGSEIKRLDGRDEAVQAAERARAQIALSAANSAALDQWARRSRAGRRWLYAAGAALAGGFTAGLIIGASGGR